MPSSVEAAERSLALVATATANDLVLVLLSGGASALWAAPAAGLDIAAKTALTRGLLKSRRRHLRDEHGAAAYLAHQGRAAAEGDAGAAC